MLARYSDPHGRLREILMRPGFGGSVLLIDRDAATRGDHRLVAHLAADEPLVNAALICRDYLSRPGGRFCRALTPTDLSLAPFAEGCHRDLDTGLDDGGWWDGEPYESELIDSHGHIYRLLPFSDRIALPELRWHCLEPLCHGGDFKPLSLRAVIAALESYEPMRGITACALARHRGDRRLSTSMLRGELERLDASPIVLNRGLREAVQKAIAQGVSMNEITIRCGRFKHDSRGGNTYGDTSWLARRVGMHPNAGKSDPTPWVHSDVLALIARRGLGISPREVELG